MWLTDETYPDAERVATLSWYFGISPECVIKQSWEDQDITKAEDYYDRQVANGKVLIGKAFVNDVYQYWHDIKLYPEED